MDQHFSLSESSLSPHESGECATQPLGKRSAADADIKSNGTRPAKVVKKRAPKACQCCRTRKVRCNVVEHGPPCTNCRLDEVECIVSESKRKKKWSSGLDGSAPDTMSAMPYNPPVFPSSSQPPYKLARRSSEHHPHTLFGDVDRRDVPLPNARPQPRIQPQLRPVLFPPGILSNFEQVSNQSTGSSSISMPMSSLISPITPSYSLPSYVKLLPAKLSRDDISYLEKKGALTIPSDAFRNELLKNYAEFIQPSMPLLNIHELVTTIDRNDGSMQISLLLFQAIMFVGIATVDLHFLQMEGFESRREARRLFFQRTRLLYDFDIETDRIALIQSLLLMTFWYETPDDQKDSHHWMGIAVSLAHTIGLHRNPEKSSALDRPRKKLWKRIWWSTYMRDRLVALGMRRPTRIKNSDFDVPALTLDDFELGLVISGPSCIPFDCAVLRSSDMQRQLAIMCIEKSKLCICMSHVLSVQYSVLNNNHGIVSDEGNTSSTVRLVARKREPDIGEVNACDKELQKWLDELPREAKYVVPTWKDVEGSRASIVAHRSLLHMIYHATSSALHRPQVLPSTTGPVRPIQSEMMQYSQSKVRLAASQITSIAHNLHRVDMVKYLPTTGITVILPAIIIHLLDIKSPEKQIREASLRGFCQCMQVLNRMKNIYAAADYSTAFLEAAIRKAEIVIPQRLDEVKDPRNVITSAQGLIEAGRRLLLFDNATCEPGALTPPPDSSDGKVLPEGEDNLVDDELARKLGSFLAPTPPGSEQTVEHIDPNLMAMYPQSDYMEPDFDSLINLDDVGDGDTWSFEDGAYAAMGGESGGFIDVDWLRVFRDNDGVDEIDPSLASEVS